MDHLYYINNCLRPLIHAIKHERPPYGTNNIKIHHDNRRPYVHKDMSTYLESEGFLTMPHSPNSPDLSPFDFWLFDLIKENPINKSDSQSLYDTVVNFMYSLSTEEYKIHLKNG